MGITQKSKANPIWSNDQLPIVADISDIIEYLDENPIPEGYTEEIINISSAQILNMGSSPIELLPELLESNEIYNISYITFIFNPATIPYTTTGVNSLKLNPLSITINKNGLQGTKQGFVFIKPQSVIQSDEYLWGSPLRQLVLTTDNGINLPDGDGSLTIRIGWKIDTI